MNNVALASSAISHEGVFQQGAVMPSVLPENPVVHSADVCAFGIALVMRALCTCPLLCISDEDCSMC